MTCQIRIQVMHENDTTFSTDDAWIDKQDEAISMGTIEVAAEFRGVSVTEQRRERECRRDNQDG